MISLFSWIKRLFKKAYDFLSKNKNFLKIQCLELNFLTKTQKTGAHKIKAAWAAGGERKEWGNRLDIMCNAGWLVLFIFVSFYLRQDYL